MLRPPSDSSDFPGLTYLQDQYSDDERGWRNSGGRNSNGIVEVIVNPTRNPPTRGTTMDSYLSDGAWESGPSDLDRRNTNVIQQIANFDQRMHLELHAEDEVDPYEDDERRFINLSLLSNVAVQLRDKVPRGTHVKGSIPYPRAFTGKDIVVCNRRHLLHCPRLTDWHTVHVTLYHPT